MSQVDEETGASESPWCLLIMLNEFSSSFFFPLVVPGLKSTPLCGDVLGHHDGLGPSPGATTEPARKETDVDGGRGGTRRGPEQTRRGKSRPSRRRASAVWTRRPDLWLNPDSVSRRGFSFFSRAAPPPRLVVAASFSHYSRPFSVGEFRVCGVFFPFGGVGGAALAGFFRI